MAALGWQWLLWASTMGAGARQSGNGRGGKDHRCDRVLLNKAKWGHAEEFLALFQKETTTPV